jgi:hypothetical protein
MHSVDLALTRIRHSVALGTQSLGTQSLRHSVVSHSVAAPLLQVGKAQTSGRQEVSFKEINQSCQFP